MKNTTERDYVQFGNLKDVGWLSHLFTTRGFCEMEPGFQRIAGTGGGIDGEGLLSRREMAVRLKNRFYPGARSLVWGEQVHGSGITVVSNPGERFSEIAGADSLMTSAPGVCLIAWAADCPVIYIADRKRRAIALVHSGRNGTLDNIAGRTVDKMRLSFGTVPEDCAAAVSPSIGPCCYPVDLWGAIKSQLLEAGLCDVHLSAVCTGCHPDSFYSYRRQKGRCGRMLAAFIIEPRV